MRRIFLFILLALLLTAQSPDYKMWLPIVLKAPIKENNWRIVQALASSNEALNPSAETTGNFSAVSGATVTRSTTFQKYGLYSYRIQSAGVGDGIQLTTRSLAATEHWVTFRVRGTFTTLQVVINSNTRTARKIEKIDANWDLYGINFTGSLVSGTNVQIIGVANGEDFYLDGIQVEPNDTWTTYIDGTQVGCAWLGTPHQAASERSGQSRAGGVSYDFWQQYKFQVKKIIGAGSSSHNISVDNYALLPGGELNSDKLVPRDWEMQGKFITDTEEELHEMRQALETAFETSDNQLTLIRFNGASTQKEIGVRYDGGLEGDISAFYGNIEILNEGEFNEVEKFTEDVTIQFISPDPRWLEVGESAIELDTNDSGTFRIVAGRLRSTGQWDTLGPPDAAGTYTRVYAIVEDETYIYLGGDFLNFDNIASADYVVRWHKQDQTYSALDTGLNAEVRVMTIAPDGDLYIGGLFTNAGGVAAADYLTRWDGSNFNAVGTPNTGAAVITAVLALQFDLQGNLYIGGDFSNWADIANADKIVMWDGSSYFALSTGANDNVEAIAVDKNNTVYIGGVFTSPFSRIASWDGSSFSDLAGGASGGNVNSLAIKKDGVTLIAGGGFTSIGGTSVVSIAEWNGTGWSALGEGMSAASSVTSLAVGPDDILYAGGNFTTAGDIDLADRVARWNNYTWAHLDVNLPGSPFILGILASQNSDPVIEQNYDLFLGFSTTGTGTFAGAVTASNEGSLPAFPQIVYARDGGATATIETLRNETTGKELLFDYDLLDGETLIIDLDPLAKSINSSFFGSRLDAVLANSDFGTWSLIRGDNNVTSYINESGTPTLVKYMQWRDTYSGYD